MSKEEELLLGYSPTELQVGEERKRNLSSVISRLSEEWDLRVDSPKKLSDSRSRGYRRGSLDLPRSPNKSLRSRSCDTTTYSPYKCKKNLLNSADFEPLVENSTEEALDNDSNTVKDSVEMEAADDTSKVDDSSEKDDSMNINDDQQSTSKEKSDDLDEVNIAKECKTENEKIGEGHDKDKSETAKCDDNLDDSFDDMEILEKVSDLVPEKEVSLQTEKKEEETPTVQTRETRRTRTSTSTGGSAAIKPHDEKNNKDEGIEYSSTPNSRETRARVGNDGETSLRESRTRQAASQKHDGDVVVGGRDTRSGRSTSLPTSQEQEDSKGVRETRARSRAVAEENQPPARSTRSNRDATPDTRKNSESKKKIDSVPRPKRGSLAEIEAKPLRKPLDVSGVDITTPERRLLRRGQDDRGSTTADTPESEPRTTRKSVTENTPERRSTRSLDTPEASKSSKSLEKEPKGIQEIRKNTDLADSVKIEESDENASLGRRLRSLRTDQNDGDKLNRKPSRSPPPKRVKTEEHKIKEESTSKTDVKKEGVVIALKKKKRRFGEKGHAFQEADIIRRVHQLKSKGMWLEKKLPKIQTEPKTKVHWDYVIEEMTWLSDVVQKELKIKKFNAKKCAAMVQKYFKDKELAKIREEKMREANLRKIAANMAREIKGFWANAQKLFEWRVKQKLERKRKEALDQHLQFIVDKTEKYSTLLAESLAESASGQVSRAASVCSGDTDDTPGDQEYAPDSASSDDEETIDKEETQAKDDTTAEAGEDEELADLEAGAEVPIEELLKKYYPDQLEKMKEGSQDDSKVDESEIKKDPDVKEETADTTSTATTSTTNTPTSTSTITTGRRQRKPIDFAEVERKIKEENAANDIFSEAAKEETKDDVKVEKDDSNKEDKKDDDLLADGEDKLEEYANMAAKFQPTGNTLETTAVKTKVPSLLKHTLREYQHIGLDWMVSLYERGLNGILADEMGLGKTIQTIALLAHLAVDRSNWGPHLIVVPTSVMLNWEMEIKKWCPGFKVMVYYGSQKERRMKRVGWTKQNAFHICITSYKLVIQDHSSFRRFRWQYFILDEAQHIKNFKSQRWQLLLNFASVGRLLLTGTPLQNNLMELWSLMHFLMPHVFESHRDFKEWFSNPLSSMVEGNNEYNDNLIKRLHKVLRPFILRRLKSEVEKQLPKKYEHLVKCPLSKRQRYLYDDFMSRANTRATLASGNLLSVINVLMQLRKCCNHPNLFEPRPTLSPFVMDMVDLRIPKLVQSCVDYNVHTDVDLSTTSLNLLHHELSVDPYTVYRASCLATPNSRMLNPPGQATQPTLSCPTNKMRLEVKSQNPPLPKQEFEHHSPVLHLPLTGLGYVIPTKVFSNKNLWLWKAGNKLKTPSGYFQIAQVPCEDHSVSSQVDDEGDITTWSPPKKILKLEDNRNSESGIKQENNLDTSGNLEVEPRRKRHENKRGMRGIFSLSLFASEKLTLAAKSPNKHKKRRLEAKAREAELNCEEYNQKRDLYINNRRSRNYKINQKRCDFMPFYGSDLVNCVEQMSLVPSQAIKTRLEQLTCKTYKTKQKDGQGFKEEISCFSDYELIHTLDSSYNRIQPIFERFILNVPNAWVTNKHETVMPNCQVSKDFTGDRLVSRFQIHVPDTRLIQYDCGKLQILSNLLRTLHLGGHRALIFTQMTRMLDVLEAFLNYHGYVYMRLDGTTKVEMRQALMERFNNNSKYFIFILSTRSGGVGINLTGADTVIFYDSDWNPTMDAQAQDRCHRIGQTRDVHIYRLISERTVEENILKKANQKRLLGDLAIEGGNFTTAFFKKQTIHDLFEEQATATNEDLKPEENTEEPKKSIGAFETALATAEDDTDRQATKDAKAEENVDEQDFNEQTEEDQFNAILAELSKVEVFALKFIESNQDDWVQGQLAAAQAEIEARKEEFDAEKLDELTQEIREEMGDISSEGGESEEDRDGDTDEGEYYPEESGSDDEETIEKDEKEVDEKNKDNEINMLENEAEVPIEELIKQYYPDQYKEMDLEIQEVNGAEIDGVAVSVTVTQSAEDSSNQMEVVEGLSTDNVVDSEEFHIETLEHVTQEVLEQVQEGLVAHEIPLAGENHTDQNDITTDDTVSTAEHLVNGNEEVHVEVLGDHHNDNAEVMKEDIIENNTAVLESSITAADKSVITAVDEAISSTSNTELSIEGSKDEDKSNQDAKIKDNHEKEANNKEVVVPHDNSKEKIDDSSEEIKTNATELTEESQPMKEEKKEEENISDTSNISLNLELSES